MINWEPYVLDSRRVKCCRTLADNLQSKFSTRTLKFKETYEFLPFHESKI